MWGKNGIQQESVISIDIQLFKHNESFLHGILLSGFMFLIFNKAVNRSLLTSIAILYLSCNAYKILFMKMGLSENTTELRSNCKGNILFWGKNKLLYCFKQNCLDYLSPIFVSSELNSLESKHKATKKIKNTFRGSVT